MEKSIEESGRAKCAACGAEVMKAKYRDEATGNHIEVSLDPSAKAYRFSITTSGVQAFPDSNARIDHAALCRKAEKPSALQSSPGKAA